MRTRDFILSILILLAGCNSLLNSNDGDVSYPAILKKKSKRKQAALARKYREANPGLCAEVDQYGLNGDKVCPFRNTLRVEITDTDIPRLKKMARTFLTKNKDFTNIEDPEQLDLEKIYKIKGCLKCNGSKENIVPIGLKLSYKNQVYNRLEIKHTGVDVFLDAKKVYQVYNHWYQNIIVPQSDKLDYQDVKDILIGKKITYYDWTGKNTITITKDSFNEYENKVIYPYETNQGLEFRVCLVVGAGIWHFYIDSTTGELIHKKQMIIF